MTNLDPHIFRSARGLRSDLGGGLTAREGLAILQALDGLNIVARDVNTVSPPHDSVGMTALLEANVMLPCLHPINLQQA